MEGLAYLSAPTEEKKETEIVFSREKLTEFLASGMHERAFRGMNVAYAKSTLKGNKSVRDMYQYHLERKGILSKGDHADDITLDDACRITIAMLDT